MFAASDVSPDKFKAICSVVNKVDKSKSLNLVVGVSTDDLMMSIDCGVHL